MTDYEKTKAFLTEMGIGFKEGVSERKGCSKTIRCDEGMPKVGGYTFFYVAFDFDADGKLVEIGAWE